MTGFHIQPRTRLVVAARILGYLPFCARLSRRIIHAEADRIEEAIRRREAWEWARKTDPERFAHAAKMTALFRETAD